MDRIWKCSPLPAMRLLRTADGALAVQANDAALRWAGANGVSAADLQAHALAAAGQDAPDARADGAEVAIGPARVHCVHVALPDGLLLWIQPLPASDAEARAQQARSTAEFLDRALTLAGVSVWRLDLATQRIHFNAVGFHVMGMVEDPAGIPVEWMRSTIHPDDVEAVVRGAQQAVATDKVVDVVARYRNTDGSWRTLLTRRVAYRDAAGQALGLAGASLDLSQQLADRARANHLADHSRLVSEVMGVGSWTRDMDGATLHWDEQMYRIHDRNPALGPPDVPEWLAQHVHAQDRQRVAVHLQQANESLDSTSDITFRLAGLEERWVQAWARRIVRNGHRLAFGMHMDVTERQREQRAQLHERERTRFAIDAAGVGIWERGPDGHLIYWNEAMYRQRGLDPADPRSPEELSLLCTHPEDRVTLAALHHQHKLTGQPYRGELRVQTPTGDWRWLLTSGHALRDDAGGLLGVIGVHLDITERKQAEAVRLEKQRIEQTSRDQSAFMARMSHELRTPLNAVLGFTRLLRDDATDPPSVRQRERLQPIAEAGAHLLSLIDEVLEISRRGAECAQPPHADTPAPVGTLAGAEPATRPLQVLCVEDNPVNLQLVRELLSLRPAVQLRTAEDGRSGLAAARAARPDLMLLDVHLPDFSGTELMRRLRTEPTMAGCLYVALSADAMPEHIEAARAAGFDDYWTKPIEFDRFLADIDRLIAAPRR